MSTNLRNLTQSKINNVPHLFVRNKYVDQLLSQDSRHRIRSYGNFCA